MRFENERRWQQQLGWNTFSRLFKRTPLFRCLRNARKPDAPRRCQLNGEAKGRDDRVTNSKDLWHLFGFFCFLQLLKRRSREEGRCKGSPNFLHEHNTTPRCLAAKSQPKLSKHARNIRRRSLVDESPDVTPRRTSFYKVEQKNVAHQDPAHHRVETHTRTHIHTRHTLLSSVPAHPRAVVCCDSPPQTMLPPPPRRRLLRRRRHNSGPPERRAEDHVAPACVRTRCVDANGGCRRRKLSLPAQHRERRPKGRSRRRSRQPTKEKRTRGGQKQSKNKTREHVVSAGPPLWACPRARQGSRTTRSVRRLAAGSGVFRPPTTPRFFSPPPSVLRACSLFPSARQNSAAEPCSPSPPGRGWREREAGGEEAPVAGTAVTASSARTLRPLASAAAASGVARGRCFLASAG